MKLPFTFNLKFAFRILLPGFILSVALLPILKTTLEGLNTIFSLEASFFITVIISGWLFVVLDMHIYMFFEGRRYWPNFLRKLSLYSERRRLDKLFAELKEFTPYAEKDRLTPDKLNKYREISFELRNFPLNDKGNFDVFYPTRLGNLIEAYETYSNRIYGMEAVFYWYRIWLILEKDLREEIDNQQSLTDSTIYASAALLGSGAICTIYALFQMFNIQFFNCSLIYYLPNAVPLFVSAILCFIGTYCLYRISLQLHATFGELFKSLFDIHRDKIPVDKIIEDISKITDGTKFNNLPEREKFKKAWRYLHNYRIKKGDKLYTPDELSNQNIINTEE